MWLAVFDPLRTFAASSQMAAMQRLQSMAAGSRTHSDLDQAVVRFGGRGQLERRLSELQRPLGTSGPIRAVPVTDSIPFEHSIQTYSRHSFRRNDLHKADCQDCHAPRQRTGATVEKVCVGHPTLDLAIQRACQPPMRKVGRRT